MATAACWIALAAAAPASAQNGPRVEEGRAHFARGVELFREGDFRAALIQFQHAYDAAPNYRILYNVAQAALELRDYPLALHSFERYLSDGGSQIAASRRTDVETEIRRLRTRVSRLTIAVEQVGATVTVDDLPVGTSPLEAPISIGVGRHRIAATWAGGQVSKIVDAAGGDEMRVELVNKDAVTPRASDASPSTAHDVATPTSAAPAMRSGAGPVVEQPRGLGAPFWITVGTTGALVAAAGVSGVVALGYRNDRDRALAAAPASPQDVDRARSGLKTSAIVTDVLVGASLIAGGLAVYLGIRAATRAPTSAIRVTPAGLAF